MAQTDHIVLIRASPGYWSNTDELTGSNRRCHGEGMHKIPFHHVRGRPEAAEHRVDRVTGRTRIIAERMNCIL